MSSSLGESSHYTPGPPAIQAGHERYNDHNDTLSILTDPLLELCPSLHSIQTLCLLSVSSLPFQEETYRTRRLEKAILRASSNGDIELLSWICYTLSRRNSIEQCPEAVAFKNIAISSLRDEEGFGPMCLAAQSGHADVVQLLVQNGAEVDERDASGWTPLMWATNSSNLPLVSFLLSHGADVEAESIKGATCEDFILSCAPEVIHDPQHLYFGHAGPSRLPMPAPLTSHDTDRQLIADLIFEHQQAIIIDREKKSLNASDGRLRSISSNSSLDSDDRSTALSSIASLPSNNAPSSEGSLRTLKSKRSTMTLRKLIGQTERTKLVEAELKARELAEGRRRALLEVAVLMEVEYSDLIGELPTEAAERIKVRNARKKERRKDDKGKSIHSGLASGCGAIEVGSEPLSIDFDFDTVRPDQMLVIGEHEVKTFLKWLIMGARPMRAPWIARSRPANVLYLCIRYACSLSDESLVEELIFGAVDRIEGGLYAHATTMTHLAFWLHNCMLLLHYMQRDTTLQQVDSMGDYRNLVAELIHEIYVFIIRDMERRIDRVMDGAILDHKSLPEFEEVRFEGDWNFMKTITGSMKRASAQNSSSPKRPLTQLFSSSDAGNAPTSPPISSNKMMGGISSNIKPNLFVAPSTPASKQLPKIPQESRSDTPTFDLFTKPSPRTITLLLTSTLHILQLYEVNPCIIVQALSQVFYWVGCELFNRILSQRKYLCKSKAMQIRLNLSALEDWVKTNALPMSIINKHLLKLNQLVSWLLCQSSLTEFDGLIATMQGFKDLNPNQMKRAVKEYRYEVGETRINAECIEYLDQLQVDMERRGKQESAKYGRYGTATQNEPKGGEMENDDESCSDETNEDDQLERVLRDGTITTQTTSSDQQNDSFRSSSSPKKKQDRIANRKARSTQKAIDRLFESGQSMMNYIPPGGTSMNQSATLLNSRDMLPFALPSQTHALIVSPGDAFGFGRGHFMGTGTPSLKSMRNESLFDSSSGGDGTSSSYSETKREEGGGSSSLHSSSSGNHLAIPPISSPHRLHYRSDTGSSLQSSSSSSHISHESENSIISTSTTSQLFPQGKGLSAGSYWQPVPILADDTLDVISTLMKRVQQEMRFHHHNRSHENEENELLKVEGDRNIKRRPSLNSRLKSAASSKTTSPMPSPNPLNDKPLPDPERDT